MSNLNVHTLTHVRYYLVDSKDNTIVFADSDFRVVKARQCKEQIDGRECWIDQATASKRARPFTIEEQLNDEILRRNLGI